MFHDAFSTRDQRSLIQVFQNHLITWSDAEAMRQGLGDDVGDGPLTLDGNNAQLAHGLSAAGDEQLGGLSDAQCFAGIDHHETPVAVHRHDACARCEKYRYRGAGCCRR